MGGSRNGVVSGGADPGLAGTGGGSCASSSVSSAGAGAGGACEGCGAAVPCTVAGAVAVA